MTDTSTTPAKKSMGWPGATALAVLFLVAGIPAGYLVIAGTHAAVNMPARVASSIAQVAAQAAQPKVSITQVVVNSIGDLRKEDKLVVYTAQVNADVTQNESYSRFGVYWGTNEARVIARGAQVQYVIDFSNLQTSDFTYDEEGRVLMLSLPRPKIDQAMVSIDPAKIQTVDLRGGWMRWDKQDTREHAIAELKPNIISQATAPYIRELAASSGIESTTKLLQPLADTLAKDGVTVKVSYRD